MSWADFLVFVSENIETFLFPCLVISIIIYYVLFKKKIISLFDPFTLTVVGSMLGFSVVLFLRITDTITNRYFMQYLFSQIAFFIGFFLYNKPLPYLLCYGNKPLKDNKRLFYIYVIASFLFIICTVITYMIAGIPLFSEGSRLQQSFVGGGTGIFARAIVIFSPVTLYLTFYFLFSSSKNIIHKIYCYLVMGLNIMFLIFSGARSSLLGIINALFLFLYLNIENYGKIFIKLKKYQFVIFVIAGIGTLGLLIFGHDSNLIDAFNTILFRLVSYGDIYYMAYPKNTIESLTSSNFFIIFFGDFFRTIRLLPSDSIPLAMGFELSAIANNLPDIQSGPNSRHNVFGYVQFGFWGSILFSFCCGLLLNTMRNKFFFTKPNASQYNKILNLLLYTAFLGLETDPPSVATRLTNIILFLPVIFVMSLVLKYIHDKKLVLKVNV